MTGGGRFGQVPARAFDDTRMTDGLVAVLGLVATYGNRDGWHGMRLREMAERRGVSKQAISAAVTKLTEYGYVETRPTTRADGGRGWNEYRVLLDVDLEPAYARVPPSTSEVDGSSSPEVDGRRQTSGTHAVANATGDSVAASDGQQLFKAVAEAWTGQQWPINVSDRSRGYIASALPDLIDLGATYDEVHRRAAVYRQHYDGKRPTPAALVKHWPALDTAPKPSNGSVPHLSIPFEQRRAEEERARRERRELVERLASER